MNKPVSWKVLGGLGLIIAVVLLVVGMAGTLAYVLCGFALLLILLAVIDYFRK